MTNFTLLSGCIFTLVAGTAFSLPFNLPYYPPQEQADAKTNSAPPPFEGKYYRITNLTGTISISITGHPILPDTTIVTDASDEWAADSSYVTFSGGIYLEYDSTGVVVDSAGYTWDEADSVLTLIDIDTSISFNYATIPGGMALTVPDTVWTSMADDGLGGFYTLTVSIQNYRATFTEIPQPVPLAYFKSPRDFRLVRHRLSDNGIIFTWENLPVNSRLSLIDLKGRKIAETLIGEKNLRLALMGQKVFLYRVEDKNGILEQGLVNSY